MAHFIKTAALTDELISAIAGLTDQQDSRHFQQLHDTTLKGLKQNSFARVNQFDVHNRLGGLEEKFRVLDREDLGDALRERLEELSGRSSKWTPEVLSLFLELSDHPVTKSKVQDLEFLKPPVPPPSLTWAEVIANDPLSDDDVWENVDYSPNSPEDEETDDSLDLLADTNETQRPSSESVDDEDNTDKNARAFLVPVDASVVHDFERTQFWAEDPAEDSLADGQGQHSFFRQGKSAINPITELQALREVLFLLSGLPSSLFIDNTGTGEISITLKYTLQHSSRDAFYKLLQSFAAIATQLQCLRHFARKKQAVPLMQTFSAAIERRLRNYNFLLSTIEERFVGNGENIVVSLIEVHAEMQPKTRPLLQLARLVTDLETVSETLPFMVLDILHEQTCVNQMVGDERDYAYMAEIFFECFHTYIEPIRRWMEHGKLEDDNDMFFVTGRSYEGGQSSLWHDRYALRQDATGKLHAPSFLHTAAKKVINTGKSVVFLKRLGAYEARSIAFSRSEPNLDFQSVCQPSLAASQAPFSELFESAFDIWIESKHHSASGTLRERLYSECGLWRSLDALEYIYFHKDGALSSIFTTTIFNKIDRAREVWNDRFLLTELAQGVFGSLPYVDARELAVRSSSGGYRDFQSRRRSVKILTTVTIDYALPWPIQNIIKLQSLSSYQRISTFLLQVSRVRYILERRRLLKEPFSAIDHEDGEAYLSYSLRHRLLWLANTLYAYLTEVVLDPSSFDMRKRMAAAIDVDAMITVHDRYILSLEDQCLISKKLAPIHQAIISLLDLGIHFSDVHAQYAGEKSFDTTNRSLASNVSQLPPWRRRRRRNDDYEDDSSEDENEDCAADTSYISFQETAYVDRLQKMREQFERLCGFVTVGLRGVSRAGGEPCWEVLADNLAWNRDFTGIAGQS
ncbi:MAG: hypothetical protein M1812_001501 [Candelaria pacifica]|nr:MAG: hypothetical protein M1812_001501 [Candelaria pacifica]